MPLNAYVAYAAAGTTQHLRMHGPHSYRSTIGFFYFYDYVLRMQLSTIADDLKDDFGATASDVSNLGSAFFYSVTCHLPTTL